MVNRDGPEDVRVDERDKSMKIAIWMKEMRK